MDSIVGKQNLLEEKDKLRIGIEQFAVSSKNYRDCVDAEKKDMENKIRHYIDLISEFVKKYGMVPEDEVNLLYNVMLCLEVPKSVTDKILNEIDLKVNSINSKNEIPAKQFT